MRKLAIGRTIGLLLAILGIGLATHWGLEASRMNARFYEWIEARPMETAIDLSRPGQITVPFHQTCSISHGESVCLTCDIDERSLTNAKEVFKDVVGSVIIKDDDGNEIENMKIETRFIQSWGDNRTAAPS